MGIDVAGIVKAIGEFGRAFIGPLNLEYKPWQLMEFLSYLLEFLKLRGL